MSNEMVFVDRFSISWIENFALVAIFAIHLHESIFKEFIYFKRKVEIVLNRMNAISL